MRHRTMLAIAGALALGFAMGHWQRGVTIERVVVRAGGPPAAAPSVVVERHVSDHGDVRAAVREELAALLAAERGEAPPPPPDVPPTEAQVAMEAKAHAVLGAAIAAGRLTTRDDNELNVLIGQLPRPQQEEMLAALVDAINTRQVLLELN